MKNENPLDLRAHFGFHSTPFTREIPIDQRWRAELFVEPLTALQATVEQRMSASEGSISPEKSSPPPVANKPVDGGVT